MRTNIIIFEGHDNSGKTTISKELAKEIGAGIFTVNVFDCFVEDGIRSKDTTNIVKFSKHLVEYMKDIEFPKPVIIDRMHLSELVYSITLDRKTDVDLISIIDLELSKLNAKIIYCYKDILIADNLLDSQEAQTARDLYRAVINSTKCEVLSINTSNENLSEQINTIKEWLE